MTSIKFNIRSIVLLFIGMLSISIINAQDSKKDKQEGKTAEIQNIVTAKDFIFVAEYVLPIGGQQRYLTPGYDMLVTKDSLSTYLPYFGRAYVAPIDPFDGGINFTSTDFKYTVEPGKKGGWNISLLPKDTRDVRQLYLSLFEDGTGTLQVISNNKQAISYTGYIKSRA